MCLHKMLRFFLHCPFAIFPRSPRGSPPPLGASLDSTISSLDEYGRRVFTAKDDRIVELTERTNELQERLLEAEETLRAKEELVRARTEAVALMSADLSLKGRSALERLEDTRTEMRRMQEEFLAREAEARTEAEVAKAESKAREDRVRHLEAETQR